MAVTWMVEVEGGDIPLWKLIGLVGSQEEAYALRRQFDRLAEAERLLRELDAAYKTEEEEHGFPFNFVLREAHRNVRAFLEQQP